jgi:hypothetical protein
MLNAYQPKDKPPYDTNSDVEGHFQKLFHPLDRPEEERRRVGRRVPSKGTYVSEMQDERDKHMRQRERLITITKT